MGDRDRDRDASAPMRLLRKGRPERSDRRSASKPVSRREKRNASGGERMEMVTKQNEGVLVKAKWYPRLQRKMRKNKENDSIEEGRKTKRKLQRFTNNDETSKLFNNDKKWEYLTRWH